MFFIASCLNSVVFGAIEPFIYILLFQSGSFLLIFDIESDITSYVIRLLNV